MAYDRRLDSLRVIGNPTGDDEIMAIDRTVGDGEQVRIKLSDVIARINGSALYNFRSDNLKKWRKAMAGVRSGSSIARLACIGDSNTAGRGTGTGAEQLTGARLKSYPAYLAAALGFPAHVNSFFGKAGVTNPATAAYDPRLTLPAAWAGSNLATLGGAIYANSTDTNSLAFAPMGNIDTIDVYYLKNGGLGTFTVDVDGGAALATVNANVAGGAIVRQTVTTTLGPHTINIKRVSGTCYIAGVDAYDSTAKKVSILNMGWSGARASNWVDPVNAYLGIGGLSGVAPDLSIICFGLNEATGEIGTVGGPGADYEAKMQTIIAEAAKTGDVILMVPQRPGTGFNQTARFDSIRNSIYALADGNDCPVIDISSRIRHDTDDALGIYYDEGHPNALGYADIAQLVAKALMI